MDQTSLKTMCDGNDNNTRGGIRTMQREQEMQKNQKSYKLHEILTWKSVTVEE